MYYKIEKKQLEQELAKRINETEAEIGALKAVAINGKLKTLTNRAVWSEVDGVGVRIGDYIGIGKALFVSYQSYHRYLTTEVMAYSYEDENGKEIGVQDFRKISRTITPIELQQKVDELIEARKKSLVEFKTDLVNAKEIVNEYNKHMIEANKVLDRVTWATRGVLSK